jgi:hypothetical protein
MYYIEKLNNGEYPPNRKCLLVKYGFKCAKQPLGSLHYGYYVSEHLRTCGQYIVNREGDYDDVELATEGLMSLKVMALLLKPLLWQRWD